MTSRECSRFPDTGELLLIFLSPMPGRLDTETRWAIIREWKRKPRSYRAIGRVLKCNHETVRDVIERYKATGDVAELPRSGRPRILKMGEVKKILCNKRRGSTRAAARMLQRERGLTVSHVTVRAQALREGYCYAIRRKKPLLTQSDRENRLAFALRSRPRGYWKRVVATDEAYFSLDMEQRGVWKKKGEETLPRTTTKFTPTVKVWGGTSWNGKTPLHVLPKSMKGPAYLDFIKKKAEGNLLQLYPLRHHPPIWLQDKDGMHTAKIVQKYLKKSPILPISSWPSHSPDFNWQEKVWEMLGQRVRMRAPTTIKGLKKNLLEEWENIDMRQVRNCIRSMPERLEAAMAAQGGNTPY